MSNDVTPSMRYRFPIPTPGIDDQVTVHPGTHHAVIPGHDGRSDLIGLAELSVVYAGQILETYACRALRSLSMECVQIVSTLTEDGIDSGTIARQLSEVDERFITVLSTIAPLVRTATSAYLRWISADTGFVDNYVSTYAKNNAAAEESELRETFATLQTCDCNQVPSPKLMEMLTEIRDSYGQRVAQITLETALSPPQISPLEGRMESQQKDVPITEASFLSRVRTCRGALLTLKRPPESYRTEVIQERLTEVLDGKVSYSERQTEIKNINSNINFEGSKSDSEFEQSGDNLSKVIGYPSGRVWVINSAFERTGFQAVIYGPSDRWGAGGWLVNPHLTSDNEQYPPEVNPHRWSLRFMTLSVTAQMFDIAGTSRERDAPIVCPLCRVSTDSCDGDRCHFGALLGSLRSRQSDLIGEIRKIDK